ncbi:LysR family transcriptional regulator [Bradyrhizobium japonicum]|uniref:LysR family transcriptional regulator n=1 Tax=Bradyrhizobium japonicum TaxID=375 RepID=UPI001E2BBE80|nr:LysR family transcriptional regulator [Bradyrhizobium japonicum]MCD9825481.1 LysR family transcriptional regulator [Bradyrhizobium japonicum]MCD9898433.1 LysR family transcriptional regulator [Bradyrhizobium japonicum]WLB33742.1 LysR family transcriptional regulator [Bradyrhizobium japonicum]
MEFRDLRWAITASQHRSLRRAAEVLRIKQSTLSRCLRSLEHTLGSTLFERTNGGTRPTIEGQEFLDAARRIVGDTEALAARLKTHSRGESGRLTIGIHVAGRQLDRAGAPAWCRHRWLCWTRGRGR